MVSKIINKELVEYPFLNKPVEVFTFENGHKLVYAYKEGELVNVSTWVKTGSINEDDENNGVSHFLEHLMFKGTTKYPAGAFDRILEAKGAIVNAATWKDYTFYYVTLPKGENNESFKQALELHADMMLDPVIPEEEVGPTFDFKNPDVKEKRERYVVIEEIRMRDDQPWTKTYNEANHSMYKSHPYKRDVIGSGEIISSIPRDSIMDYYKTWYTPDNMTTIIVGDVQSDEVVKLVQENFVFNEIKSSPKVELPIEKEQTEELYLENTSSVNTGFMILGFHGPKAMNLKDSIVLDVLTLVLGEGKSSRLYQNLIEKQEEPVFSVVGADQYQFKDGNNVFIQANFKADKKEQALNLVKKELSLITENLITDEEFKKACKKLKVRFADGAETVSDIGENIGFYMTVCEDLSACSDYLSILNSLSVEDIKEIANKYLSLNKATISVLMPEA